jgi:hypothetical protein
VGDASLLTLGRTVGAGHFHQFEVPDQIVAMLERWLEVTWPHREPDRSSQVED